MPAPPSLVQVAIRFGLGVLAFVLLWRVPEPQLLAIPNPDDTLGQVEAISISSLLLQVVVGAVAGAVFALAARPIWGSWSYRGKLPLVLGLIPATIIAVEVLAFSSTVSVPTQGLWGRTALFLISNFSLRVTAILLGVALAQGVMAAAEDPEVEEETTP